MAISPYSHTVIAHEILSDAAKLLRIARSKVYPLETLSRVAGVLEMLETAERKLVAGARQDGATWEDIASALGVTRQAATQRFGGGSAIDSERAS